MHSVRNRHDNSFDRYYEDEKRVARKMEVLVGMQHSINLEHLRAAGPQPDERMQPTSDAGGAPAAAVPTPSGPQPSAEIVANLAAVLGGGFSENAFKRAALAVGNSDANAAMNWLLTHSEDADINSPLEQPAGGGAAAAAASGGGGAAGGGDAESVGQIVDMGFNERQARAALKAGGGGVDRAVAWLFDQGDQLDAEVERMSSAAAAANAEPRAPKVRTASFAYVMIYMRRTRATRAA